MTKARTTPVWLVLLPALALAAVGARAVTAEMRASQEAARDRARSIASRLARSVDALVEEYAVPLPKAGTNLTRVEAIEATAHLRPRRAVTTNGVSLSLDHDPPDPGPIPSKEEGLVEDALQSARRLAGEPNGTIAAAALTAAAARAVENRVAKARLLYAAADYELPSVAKGDGHFRDGERFDWLHEAVSAGAFLRREDGEPFDLHGVRLAVHLALNGTWQGAWKFDLAALHDRIAEDPWGLDDEDRLEARRLAEGRLRGLVWETPGPAAPDFGSGWDAARAMARGLDDGSRPPSATLSVDGLGERLSVWTDVEVDGRRALLGGDVPWMSQSFRIGGEAAALVHEADVFSVRLVAADGAHVFDEHGAGASPPALVVESVPLSAPIASWRAEASVIPASGVPATAWLLGAAVIATTAALLAGTIALRRAADRSARLAGDRQTFLDHVAHELRTPAAAVQALTEELASGHVPAEREAVYRGHLLRESRRLSSLVEDTLDFTRLDAGRLAFKMAPADLRDVVREAIEQSDGAGRVVATLPDEAVVRDVDAGALRRAVKNLVENAVRHGGGDEPVAVTLEARNGVASIAVTDHGRGIAAEHLPRLFERFYRVPSPTHEVKGVGLGLALCREVARAHGGDVEVTSELGKGSTFTLRIPNA